MKDKELKPCPFCGGKAELIKGVMIFGKFPYKIICTNKKCEIYYLQTKPKFSPKDAVEIWNRRVENGG